MRRALNGFIAGLGLFAIWLLCSGQTFINGDPVAKYFFTNNGVATASLRTCNAALEGTFAYDTTTNNLTVCNGTAWVATGATISGLTTNTIPKATSATAIGDSSLSDDGTNVTSTEPFLAPATLDAQLYSFTGDPDTGMGRGAANNLRLYAGGVLAFTCNATNCFMNAPSGLVINTIKLDIANEDMILGRDAAANLQLGVDSATPISQVISAADGSGTDIAGGSTTIAAGQSTGTGIGGDLVLQTSPSGTTAATLNALGDRSRVLAKYTTLTETVATAFARVAVAAGTVVGGQVVVTVEANDGTDFQARTLRFGYSAVNKAGTTTAGIDTPSESVAVSVGTLTCTITAADATNNVDLLANCTSSLTQTVLRANAVVVAKNFGVGAISAQ